VDRWDAEIERLRARGPDRFYEIEAWCNQLEAANERLRAALQRIDGINDNPAVYNPMIEEVLRRALEQKP